jgi:hypothetical protein
MLPIVKLLKYLYGRPQASKYFDERLSVSLLRMGFTQCISDNQLFVLRRNYDFVYLLKHRRKQLSTTQIYRYGEKHILSLLALNLLTSLV